MNEEKKLTPDEQQAISKFSNFLTLPKGVGDIPELLETQADLSSTATAALLIYNRTLAGEFDTFNPDGEDPKTRINKAQAFATRLSIMTQAIRRGARNDSVMGATHSGGQKPAMFVEALDTMPIRPPQGVDQPQEKKRFKVF